MKTLFNNTDKMTLVNSLKYQESVYFTVDLGDNNYLDGKIRVWEMFNVGKSETLLAVKKFYNHPLDESKYTFTTEEGQMSVEKVTENTFTAFIYDFLGRRQTIRVKWEDVTLLAKGDINAEYTIYHSLNKQHVVEDFEVVRMTQNEYKVLQDINGSWHEEEGGYSEYSSVVRTITRSEGGTIASLVAKDLIYDCYDNMEGEEPMWCMTCLGASVMLAKGYDEYENLIYVEEDLPSVEVLIS